MQWWMLGAVSNGVIAVAYFMICFVITRGLLKGGQLGSNRLGAATAAIFLSCAVPHGAHMVHMLMPYAGVDLRQGLAMREAWGPQLAFWDLLSAMIGVYYWTLRGGFGSVGASPQLFADQHEREQRALELNDAVLQGMVVARMAFDLNEPQRAMNALDGSIAAASKMITELIGDERGHLANRPLRSTPALVPQAEGASHPSAPSAGSAPTATGPTTTDGPDVPAGPAP
jgi:hypothetical protein